MRGITPSLRTKRILAFACAFILAVAFFITLSASAWADTGNWTTSKSKTATWIDEGKTARVTLQLPSSEAKLSSDIVFVVDNSSCRDNAINDAKATLDRLVAEVAGADQVKVGVVSFRGDGHVEKQLSELNASNVDAFKGAISGGYTGDLKSGTNMQDGLAKAKAMLDADTDTPANRKHVILVSDGLTRLFTTDDGIVKDIYYQYSYTDPTSQQTASEIDPKNFVYFGMIDEWHQARTSASSTYAMPYGDWDTYYSHLVRWVANDGNTYAHDFKTYGNDATNKVKDSATGAIIDPNFTFIEHGTQADHAMAPDRAVYESYNVWQALKSEGYTCYAVRTGSDSDFSIKFMNQLNSGTSLDFTQIANNILYACDAGSKITDSMGKGENYDFDFVSGTATVNVGSEQLEVTKESENTWSFHSTGSTNARFTLVYDAEADTYEFTTHEPISNFAPVKLTYDITLAKAPTEPGDYELATNTKAALLPVNSAGVQGAAESFDVPKLTYTVKTPSNPENPEKPEAESPNPTTTTTTDTPSGKTLPQMDDPVSFLSFIATTLVIAAIIGTVAGVRVLKKH